ncbi:MAG TPA: hypothetical protein DCY53_01540 [Desulfobacteraceae bacterium]|nr:hypothetical protein [Desulfobacteraceae bacterium]
MTAFKLFRNISIAFDFPGINLVKNVNPYSGLNQMKVHRKTLHPFGDFIHRIFKRTSRPVLL